MTVSVVGFKTCSITELTALRKKNASKKRNIRCQNKGCTSELLGALLFILPVDDVCILAQVGKELMSV